MEEGGWRERQNQQQQQQQANKKIIIMEMGGNVDGNALPAIQELQNAARGWSIPDQREKRCSVQRVVLWVCVRACRCVEGVVGKGATKGESRPCKF